MKHCFISKILQKQLQCTGNILCQRIQHDPSGPVNKAGNLHLGKFRFHERCITFQITGDQRNITILKSFLPDQYLNLKPHLMHLLHRCGHLHQMNTVLLLQKGLHLIPKQILLQRPQRRTNCKPIPLPGGHEHILPSGYTHLCRQLIQITNRLLRQMKQPLLPVQLIGVLSGSQRQADDGFLRQFHNLLNHPILNGRKARKPIKYHHTPGDQHGFGKTAAKHL